MTSVVTRSTLTRKVGWAGALRLTGGWRAPAPARARRRSAKTRRHEQAEEPRGQKRSGSAHTIDYTHANRRQRRSRGVRPEAGIGRKTDSTGPRRPRSRHPFDRARWTIPIRPKRSPWPSGTSRPIAGIIVCGSGAGVSIAASKFPGVRAAVCHDTYTAHQAVEHDDMNVLCLGSRVIGAGARPRGRDGLSRRQLLR